MKGFSVADGDEVRFSNVRNDRNFGGKVEVDWQRNEFVEGKKVFHFNIWYMKNEDYRMFLRAMNERGFQFVAVGRLMNEDVKFVFCSRVLDVVDDGFQNIDTESSWSKFLIECQMDDLLANCNDSPKFVVV